MAGIFDWLFPQQQGDASVPVSGDAGQASANTNPWGGGTMGQIGNAITGNQQSLIGFGLGLMSGDSKGDAYRNALLGAQRGVVLDASSRKEKQADEEKKKRQQAILNAFNGNAALKPYMGAAVANPDFGESLLKAQAANALDPAEYTYQQGADGIYAVNRKNPSDIRKLDIPAGKPGWAPVTIEDGTGNKRTIFQNGDQFKTPDQLGIPGGNAQGGNPAYTGKMNKEESDAATYADRTAAAHQVILQNEGINTGMSGGVASDISRIPGVGNQLSSENRQKFNQAKRNFINATLRRESGAVISPSEFENGDQQYFPQPGDSQAVIEQKRRNRELVIQGLQRSAGPNYRPPPPKASDAVKGGRQTSTGVQWSIEGN